MEHDEDCKFFRTLADNLVIGAARVSSNGEFVWVNAALEEILGYSSAELLGTKWQNYTHPHDLGPDSAMVKELLTTGRTRYGMTKRYLTKMGKIVWVSLHVSEVTEKENFLYFVSQIVPIEQENSVQSLPPPRSQPPETLVSEKLLAKLLGSGWGIITVVGSSIAVIAATVIEKLYEKGIL